MPTKFLICLAIIVSAFFSGVHYEKLTNIAQAQKIERKEAVEIIEADKKLKEENDQDKALYLAVRTGTQRLRLPANVSTSPVDAGAVPAQGCELDPKTAADLVSITQEGDAAIRQLNELIDLYAK